MPGAHLGGEGSRSGETANAGPEGRTGAPGGAEIDFRRKPPGASVRGRDGSNERERASQLIPKRSEEKNGISHAKARRARRIFPGSTPVPGVVFGVPPKNRSKIHPVGGTPTSTREKPARERFVIREESKVWCREHNRNGVKHRACSPAFVPSRFRGSAGGIFALWRWWSSLLFVLFVFFVVEYRIPTSNQRESDSISQKQISSPQTGGG